jgi:hypothetical protein
MNAIAIDTTKIPAPVMAAHCRSLLNAIGGFFDDPKNQQDYEAWHVERYGYPPREASYINNQGKEDRP